MAADAAQKHIADADLVSLSAEEALYALVFIADQDILEVPLENPLDLYARAKVNHVPEVHRLLWSNPALAGRLYVAGCLAGQYNPGPA